MKFLGWKLLFQSSGHLKGLVFYAVSCHLILGLGSGLELEE